MNPLDEIDLEPKPPKRDRSRLVYGILQVLGCTSMALAGYSINLTVGLAVTGVEMLALGVGLERQSHAR
jgi:hypothetical protein